MVVVLGGLADVSLVVWLMSQRVKQIRADRDRERAERDFLRLYPKRKELVSGAVHGDRNARVRRRL